MQVSPDLDLKFIEDREWQLWSMTLVLLAILWGLTAGSFLFMSPLVYADSALTRALSSRALGGLVILIALFCLYVIHTHLTLRRLRGLLVDMGMMVASTEELNVLLSSFALRIAQASSADLCLIALLTPSGSGLVLRAAHSAAEECWEPRIGKIYPLARIAPFRRILEARHPVVFHQTDLMHIQDSRDASELLTGDLKGIGQAIVIPMVTKGRVVGVLVLGDAAGFRVRRPTSSRIVLSQALAKQAATAIDHAGLVEKLQKTSISILQATLDSTADGILVVDHAGKIMSFNRQFARMWRLPESLLASGDDKEVLKGIAGQLKNSGQFMEKTQSLYARKEAQGHETWELKDGRIFERFSQPHQIDGQPAGRVWNYRDVTAHKRAQADLEKQATHDDLTDLYNRRYFNRCMEKEIGQADRNRQTLAVLICNLDRFKAINDSRGHHVGDEVLKAAAKSIAESTREMDLIFRWGGDEFVIVLSNVTRDGVLMAAERIRRGIRQTGDRMHFGIDVSIGVALYPEHGRNAEELIRLADRALNIAKKGGDRLYIGAQEYSLDDRSIDVVYQPIVDLGSGRTVGYEALSRDPTGNRDIIELFKRYHAIGQLNKLKRLCFTVQLKASQEHALERVFINVDFDALKELEPMPKPPGTDVILEISEAKALRDVEGHLEIARKWREQGYTFAIDDFGAGFVSLPFIARLLPAYIKVDRSALLQAVSSEQFKKFMIDLIPALRNYSTEGIIAEGIETEEELSVSKEMGIHIVQGFLFGRPQAWSG